MLAGDRACTVRTALIAGLALLAAAAWAPSARGAGTTTSDCIAAADQGQSLRDEGHYRRAREALTRCARDDCPAIIARSCSGWLRQLEGAMPTVVLGAKDEQGHELSTVHVTLDGVTLVDHLDQAAVAIDPGDHVLRFEQDQRVPAEVRVTIRGGEKSVPITATLAPVPVVATVPSIATVAPPSPSSTAPPSLAPLPGEPMPPAPVPSAPARSVTALSLLVAGVATGGGAAYLLSQSGNDSRLAGNIRATMPSDGCTHAPTSVACERLSSTVDAQHLDSAVGTAMVVGAGALVAAAVVTWMAWPVPHERVGVWWVGPGVTSGRASLAAGGAF